MLLIQFILREILINQETYWTNRIKHNTMWTDRCEARWKLIKKGNTLIWGNTISLTLFMLTVIIRLMWALIRAQVIIIFDIYNNSGRHSMINLSALGSGVTNQWQPSTNTLAIHLLTRSSDLPILKPKLSISGQSMKHCLAVERGVYVMWELV